MLSTIGEGGYADGIRARIIRDRLMSIDKATPQDMLAIQLEDRALFLERWRKLLLDELASSSGKRAEFRNLVDTKWTGRASPGSVGYRLVSEFRLLFVRRVMTAHGVRTRRRSHVRLHAAAARRGPVWQIIAERPMHLLDPKYKTWTPRSSTRLTP